MAAAEFASLAAGHAPTRVQVDLFGSLGATGGGHGSVQAIALGLEGNEPKTVAVELAPARMLQLAESGELLLNGEWRIPFDAATDIVLHRRVRLPAHSNGMRFQAICGTDVVLDKTYYSVGGGVVLEADLDGNLRLPPETVIVPFAFNTAADLLAVGSEHRLSIPELALANECARQDEAAVRAGLDEIWTTMQGCVAKGSVTSGVLPGGLRVRRRAARMSRDMRKRSPEDPLTVIDWLTLWALAVNEENAAGGRVVTAPTNGAAGIIPATLHYVMRFTPSCDQQTVHDFLLTAGAIGAIFQQTASISGAEVGCQGEVGTACAMASAAICHAFGGNTQQVLNAAEIGLEHNLGLTCDPVGGLVQIPCIERNAVAAVKAVTAARLAMAGDGQQIVSLDQVIATMMQTGRDMQAKYKETAEGGLAVNIVEC